MVHLLDFVDLCLECLDCVLQRVVKALGHLLVGGDEKLINFDGHECCAPCAKHRLLESLELLTLDDLSVIALVRLVSPDLLQVL